MRRWNTRRVLLVAGLAAALVTVPAAAQDATRISAVATFSILGDLVKNVGGDRVDVVTLVGPDGDAHVYSPSPADAKILAAARLIVVNGLGFEGWMDRLVQVSAAKAEVVVASTSVAPRPAAGLTNAALATDRLDPHAWQSIRNAEIYVANIRDGLIRADPAAVF